MNIERRLLTLTLFLLVFTANASGQSAKIEGHVSDDQDKRVTSVRIVVTPGGQSTTTDSKGHFVIHLPANVPPAPSTFSAVTKTYHLTAYGWNSYSTR